MIIADAHLDLGLNAVQGNRNLIESALTIRATEHSITTHKEAGLGTVALPEMCRGRVAFFFLLRCWPAQPGGPSDTLTMPRPPRVTAWPTPIWPTIEPSLRKGTAASLPISPNWTPISLSGWPGEATEPQNAEDTPPLGFVISMESADPILTPAQLPQWWDNGLRLIGPAHYGPGRYAGGTGTEAGLSDLGRTLLAEMERLGFALDLSHLTDQAFWPALEIFNGPVLASHNNCRALVSHQRQLADAQLQAIIERDGVIGVALDCWMLEEGWVVGRSSNASVTLNTVIDHVDHICQLAGNTHHVALGSDLDGGFGKDETPSDVDTIADLQKFCGLLADRGYHDDDIANILHGNWLRFLRRLWG